MVVHCVGRKRGTTKADVILPAIEAAIEAAVEAAAAGSAGTEPRKVRAVFVDDSPAELVDPHLLKCSGLHRVLFNRS
jgi:hypothetical protein